MTFFFCMVPTTEMQGTKLFDHFKLLWLKDLRFNQRTRCEAKNSIAFDKIMYILCTAKEKKNILFM